MVNRGFESRPSLTNPAEGAEGEPTANPFVNATKKWADDMKQKFAVEGVVGALFIGGGVAGLLALLGKLWTSGLEVDEPRTSGNVVRQPWPPT